MEKIYMQPEATSSLEKGDKFFFLSSGREFNIGEVVELSNFSHTLTTDAFITQRAKKFYEGEIMTFPVQDRLDLTHIQ